ncbi:MAG: ABC transporter permease, partial [Lactobacillus iners]|nr:ABC transporter permease [Lactobacillus iners]MCT7808925.1 ABC transporter permease [Lactobacillus iners]
MQKIANKRLNSNARKQIHYLALVFNDFFVLALLLIFGALMFWYAKSIQTWPRNLWYYSPLLALVFSISFGFGSLVTLFEHADQQFLLSLDDQLEFYLKPMLKYSMVLPTIILLLVGGIAFPLAFLRMAIHPINYLILLVDMLLLKHVQHLLQEHSLYFNDKLHYNTIAFAVIGYFLILLGIYQPLVLLAIIVVAMVYIIR